MSECLGIAALGLCSYDPSNPAVVYFSIGDAIAALSIALVLPQFLKPIFIFRLNSRRLSLPVIYLMVFLGVLAVAIGALLPSLPISRTSIVAYPILWEVIGAALFLVTYGALALSVVWPSRLMRGHVPKFVKSAAKLLSEADANAQIDFAEELDANIVRLVEFASFDEWREDRSAFYDFINQNRIADAQFARALLSLVSDSVFCCTLVSRCPWIAARMLDTVSTQHISLRSARPFVQEVARQAIVSPHSILGREVEFGGFGAAPVLSTALFGSRRIVRECEPLDYLQLNFDLPSSEVVKRINSAAETCLTTVLDNQDYWQAHALSALPDAYSSFLRRLTEAKGDQDHDLQFAVTSGVIHLIRNMRAHLNEMEGRRYNLLFAQDNDGHEHNVVEVIAELAYETLAAISNRFRGHSDQWWLFVCDWFHELFPNNETEKGMDPLQQRVALKLLKKVRGNMECAYPAISRPLIAIMDPYSDQPFDESEHRDAYSILALALFLEWKRFADIAKKTPDMLRHFLPENVRYDATANAFRHSYWRSGEELGTDLSLISATPLSFFDSLAKRERSERNGKALPPFT